MGKERKIASPRPCSETAAFWEAAERGELVLKACRDCGEFFHYPRTICPLCGSAGTEWRRSTGSATVYACSVARRVPEPYCIAYVRLDEGPVILSNIVSDDLDSVRIGQRVQVVFVPSEDGQPVPMFTPAAGERTGRDPTV